MNSIPPYKLRLCLCLFNLTIVILSGCSSLPAQLVPSTVTPTITPTAIPTATATPTPTPVPLADLDLVPLLIQTGDLPAGFSPAHVSNIMPLMFEDNPTADLQIYQQFESQGDTAGGVAVFLYEDDTLRTNTYDIMVGWIASDEDTGSEFTYKVSELQDIGEQGKIGILEGSLLGIKLDNMDLAFIRCTAVVYVRMTGLSDGRQIITYAQHLDNRLTPIVCR